MQEIVIILHFFNPTLYLKNKEKWLANENKIQENNEIHVFAILHAEIIRRGQPKQNFVAPFQYSPF